MQIFVLSHIPLITSIILDDIRTRKMTVEQAQLICSRLPNSPYRPYNPNCGLAKWVHETPENFSWSVLNLKSLIDENIHRFGKIPGRTLEVYHFAKQFIKHNNPRPLKFYNESMFKDEKNIFKAYEKTLIYKWKHDKIKLTWTNREIPQIFKENYYEN